jgi:hypothetical protein
MKVEARITLVYGDHKEAKAVSEAVSPDNIRTPQDLSVETYNTDNRVTTSIQYRGDNLMTFHSTVDDLLSCVSVAEKTFQAIEQLREAAK